MDEVTTDLDVVSRQALLQFLREECEARGATVVYSTHILDGLDDWPTHVLHLRGGRVAYNGPVGGAPGAKAALGDSAGAASGSLFTLVKGWLMTEREEKASAAANVECAPTPSTSEVAAVAPEPAAPATFGSRFDRFGGACRQGSIRAKRRRRRSRQECSQRRRHRAARAALRLGRELAGTGAGGADEGGIGALWASVSTYTRIEGGVAYVATCCVRMRAW